MHAANPALQELLGYTESELLNLSSLSTDVDASREDRRRLLDRLVDGSLVEIRQQRRYRHRTGATILANVRESLIPGTPDLPPTLITVVEDITKQKQSAEELAQTKEALARVSRVTTMGELAASIAHEVNQPLTAVVVNGHACLRWLSTEPRNDLEVQDAIQRIVRDANRASEVIGRIRGFLKRSRTDRSMVGMADVIEDVVGLTRDSLKAADIHLVRHVDPDLPCVFADSVQLQQVILNLLMNSIEAMSTSGLSERRLELRVVRHGAVVAVSVTDSGAGAAPDDLDRMFEAFYTTKPDGMGMGLAICRSIVESHGGRLWASVNQKQGLTLQFSLPIAEPAET